MNTTDAKRVVETALICAQQPLPLRELELLFDRALGDDTLRAILDDLQNDWSQRGVELVHVATGWRVQSKPEMRPYLDKLHPEKPPRYSRAVMETLAIIAYRQPVTRGDMEDIRGVTINSMIFKQLEDRGWVEVIGHREAAGRPALYATTKQFLDDLGVDSLEKLPIMENRADRVPDAIELAALGQGHFDGGNESLVDLQDNNADSGSRERNNLVGSAASLPDSGDPQKHSSDSSEPRHDGQFHE
jgi:segregation and condensation protein B